MISSLALSASQSVPIVSATASSNSSTAHLTIDGDPQSRWAANNIGTWIQYDLGSTQTIDGIEISWFNGDSRIAYFEVQTSTNGSDWSTIYDGQSSGETTDLELTSLPTTNTRYVRIVNQGNSSNNWISIYLVDLVVGAPSGGSSGILPIAQATASASSSTAHRTIDGNPTTRWAADGLGHWIQYDLGSIQSVNGIDIAWFNGDSRVAYYTIQASTNGSQWTSIYTGQSSGQTSALEFTSLPTTEARYLRVVNNGNSANNWISIYLVQIHGAGGSSVPSDEDIIAAGLVAWNKPDGDGISCAECHTPFGYDVAIFDFDQEDLRRATAPHLTDDDADDIFAMIEVLRDWYPPQGGLKNVETFRPFQPGGTVLGGANASLQDRDDAFALYLRDTVNLRIAQSAPISTLTVANQALNELNNLDLTQLPIGIELNRWSESVSRSGTIEGGRIAEWLPGMGLQPKSQHANEWNTLVDNYVAYPSDENFWAFFHKIESFLDFDPVNSAPLNEKANRWMSMTRDIYKSNNIFTHNELNKALSAPELNFSDGTYTFPDQNGMGSNMSFIWDVGNAARELDGGNSYFNQMPLRHQETLYNAGGNAWKDRITDLRTTWMWLGFTMHPVMLHVPGGGNAARSLEYTMNWSGRPHRSHYAFAQAALVTKRGFYIAESQSADFILGQKSNFFAYGRWTDHTWDTTPGALDVYKALVANFHRAALIRKTHEINTHGRHWQSESILVNDGNLYRNAMNWADPANETLNDQIADAFIAAVQSNPQ